jgi:hypothetical protein
LPVGNASIGNNGTISSVETRRRLIVHCKTIISFHFSLTQSILNSTWRWQPGCINCNRIANLGDRHWF